MAQISTSGLQVLAWTFVGVDVALTAGRYATRITGSGLHLDDALHGLALAVVIAYVALVTTSLGLEYAVEQYATGITHEMPPDNDIERYFRINFGGALLFWLSLYAVKFTFLVFYRILFGVSTVFRRAWYAVLALTVTTFLINFISVFWICGSPEHLLEVEYCTAPATYQITITITRMWCPLNVVSSLAILALPLSVVRSLQMSRGQKWGLCGAFILGGVDILFDIIRTYYTTRSGSVATSNLWDILEVTVAVMLSGLVSLRQVFRLFKRQKSTPYRNIESGVELTRMATNNERPGHATPRAKGPYATSVFSEVT